MVTKNRHLLLPLHFLTYAHYLILNIFGIRILILIYGLHPTQSIALGLE